MSEGATGRVNSPSKSVVVPVVVPEMRTAAPMSGSRVSASRTRPVSGCAVREWETKRRRVRIMVWAEREVKYLFITFALKFGAKVQGFCYVIAKEI